MALQLFAFSVLLLAISCTQTQDVPPKYAPHNWCEAPELAKAVGVTKQCEAFTKAVWNEKVNFSVVYGTWCEWCTLFMTSVMHPVLYPKWKDYVNFELLLNSDARRNEEIGFKKGLHGPQKMDWAMLEVCAIHHLTNVDSRMDFIYCIEARNESVAPALAITTKCFKNASVSSDDVQKIMLCTNSTEGHELNEEMKQRIKNIWPHKVQGIPWFFINDASTEQAQAAWNINMDPEAVVAAFSEHICNAYQGDKMLSELCNGDSSKSNHKICAVQF